MPCITFKATGISDVTVTLFDMKGTFICSVTDILIYISTRALFIPYSLIFVLTLLSTLPIIFNFIGILGPKLDRKPLFVIVPNGISYIIPFVA